MLIHTGSSLDRSVIFAGLAIICMSLFFPAWAEEAGPIAYIGHGAFFDQEGRQIVVTQAFVAKAQDWYRAKLLSGLKEDKKAEFNKLENQFAKGMEAQGQTRLVAQQRLLDWLSMNGSKVDPETLGKLKALESALRWKLPDKPDFEERQPREIFKIDPALEETLKLPALMPGTGVVFAVTTNRGQAYIDECRAAGVPIPPPIGCIDPAGPTPPPSQCRGLGLWESQGFIPMNQQFITGAPSGNPTSPAEVRTFKSTSPPGMCIALPRYSDTSLTTVELDGVICLGQTSSKNCYWDNQMNRTTFNFPAGTLIPIGVPNLAINPAGQYQAGGAELESGQGGVCTNCHAGQNPYIVHPNANLGGGKLMGDLGDPPVNLPMFSAARYDPLVPASWSQNQRSHSIALVPSRCSGCHDVGGSGGTFPHLSSELNSYCGTILRAALGVKPLDSRIIPPPTMPPSAPGSLRCTPNLPATDPRFAACTPAMTASCSSLPASAHLYIACTPEINQFLNWCNSPASSGPSNRGDPHLITADGTPYDFQSVGEFVALRDSDGLEIQTRQTPV